MKKMDRVKYIGNVEADKLKYNGTFGTISMISELEFQTMFYVEFDSPVKFDGDEQLWDARWINGYIGLQLNVLEKI